MLIRVVRMEFQPDCVAEFLAHFHTVKHRIRAQAGCRYLSLHQDASQPHVYYTLSHWDSQAALDAYRDSHLFRETWTFTKARFAAKAQAYSLSQVEELP